MSNTIKNITVFVHQGGQYKATVEFERSLSKSDKRPEFNLERAMPGIRSKARTVMIEAIAANEQRVNETRNEASSRVRNSLSRLVVAEPDIDHHNRWRGVSFVETFWVTSSTDPLVTVHG